MFCVWGTEWPDKVKIVGLQEKSILCVLCGAEIRSVRAAERRNTNNLQMKSIMKGSNHEQEGTN